MDRLDMTGIIFRSTGSGPAVLALHAFPLNSAMWEDQIAALGTHVTIHAPDLPGFGSSAQAQVVEDLDALAHAIVIELRDHNVDEATVMGCSLGGYLAFALLRVAPRFVRGLILINSKAAADPEQAKAMRLATAVRAEREGCDFLVKEWPQTALSSSTLTRRPSVVEAVRSMIAQATPAGVAAAQRAMAARPDSTGLLTRITTPVLVIHGVDDRFIPLADAEAMAQAIRSAHFVPVPDAGHLPNLEQASTVNDAIEPFLKEMARRSSSRV